MITVGTHIAWRRKSSELKELVNQGVVAQWRPSPDRVEIVPGVGRTRGEWVNEDEMEYIITKKVRE